MRFPYLPSFDKHKTTSFIKVRSQNFATQQYKKTAFCRPVQTQFIASQTDFTIEKRQKEQQEQQGAGFCRLVQAQFIASQTDFTIEKRQKEQQRQQEAAFTPCTGAIHCVSNGEAIET